MWFGKLSHMLSFPKEENKMEKEIQKEIQKELDKLRLEIEDIRRKLDFLSETVAEMKRKEAEKSVLLRPIR